MALLDPLDATAEREREREGLVVSGVEASLYGQGLRTGIGHVEHWGHSTLQRAAGYLGSGWGLHEV